VVFVEQGQRRIPGAVRQAHDRPPNVRRHLDLLPLKVNQAGVIPVIFASSLLYLPDLIPG
jgi:preprotein translocase subunit SecY